MNTWVHKLAEERGIPLRTLEQVRADIEAARATKADKALARTIANVGRCTDEAREYARQYASG